MWNHICHNFFYLVKTMYPTAPKLTISCGANGLKALPEQQELSSPNTGSHTKEKDLGSQLHIPWSENILNKCNLPFLHSSLLKLMLLPHLTTTWANNTIFYEGILMSFNFSVSSKICLINLHADMDELVKAATSVTLTTYHSCIYTQTCTSMQIFMPPATSRWRCIFQWCWIQLFLTTLNMSSAMQHGFWTCFVFLKIPARICQYTRGISHISQEKVLSPCPLPGIIES